MRAAKAFADQLQARHLLAQTARIHTTLYGSLALTGKGHGTDRAVFAGLEGNDPETADPDYVTTALDDASESGVIHVCGTKDLPFERGDIEFNLRKPLPLHPNGMRFKALAKDGSIVAEQEIYSIGGGFIATKEELEAKLAGTRNVKVTEEERGDSAHESSVSNNAAVSGKRSVAPDGTMPPTEKERNVPPDGGTSPVYTFKNAAELMALCEAHNKTVAQIMWDNEVSQSSPEKVRAGLMRVWDTMRMSVRRGCTAEESLLPGVLRVRRRAPGIYQKLRGENSGVFTDSAEGLKTAKNLISSESPASEWTALFALAVNEENASGGRIVTAPTNGAAGIIPAVLHYYWSFIEGADEQGVIDFLMTAAAVGYLFKRNGSISGAEVGCQGEVGSACSMAAAAMCAVLGGTPRQVENAAEIGIEHNLGLTCDPVEGLVQIPCIERNAIASNTAINAARVAMLGDGHHIVSLDQAIQTMKQTGADMMAKYKETSRGGLAVTVRVVEC
jgi:L-serine dehydratase